MAEAVEFIGKSDSTELKGFVKKFTNLSPKEAKELRKKIETLDLIKLRMEQIVKIVELLPENSEELNKIVDTSLNEDETRKILDTVKEFK